MVFDAGYSAVYDLLYQDVDYAGAVDQVESHLSDGMGLTLLDLGCGTGRHLEFFKHRHKKVVGVDISAGMLKRAAQLNPDVELLCQDARSFVLNGHFDVVVMMSAVLCYQITNQDVIDTFRRVHDHLVPGGLFIFDVWHGPTVLYTKPERRAKRIQDKDFDLIRVVEPKVHLMTNMVTCSYSWKFVKKDEDVDIGAAYADGSEVHKARYFFPTEIDLFARTTGFDVLNVARADNGKPFGENDDYWHARYVLQRV
jgi:SAM-dependent methyltransferase